MGLSGPAGMDATREAIAEVERGLDALPSGGGCALRGGARDRLASRLAAVSGRIDSMRRGGLDVGREEARLATCHARLSVTPAGC